LIVAAGDPANPGSIGALAELCRVYWYPIYAMIRRRGHSPDDSGDLTQDFFTRLLDGRLIRAADRDRGRFRTFLRTDCGYFLSDQADRKRSIKHGGGARFVPIDGEAERRFSQELSDSSDPEVLFDRAWAVALLERAFDRLGRQEAEAGRGESFERLKTTLTDGSQSRPYAEIAADMATTVTAIQAAIVRLRRRYRAALRAEVASTLGTPTEPEIDDEIRSLWTVLSR
jgi:DNA-directed RNA polymerase specialized sigma24 family protein